MKRILSLCLIALMGLYATAQSITTASSSMTANPWTESIPYNITDQGKKHTFVAGMGGWSWDFFAYKERNWVGQEYQNIARVGFLGRHSTSSSQPTSLSNDQKTAIDAELNNISPTGAKKLLLLCDVDPNTTIGGLSESSWCGTLGYVSNTVKRRRNNYVKDIQLAVEYIESKGYTVVAVAPFNEPDYDANKNSGKSANAFNAVAEVMQNNATLRGRVFGPNTLNNSNGKTWYNTVKNNINFVNTHQLDGTFADLVSFWDTGIKDGKRALADEMHNVLEAMVSMNHGAEYGTWWAYDGVARAEFSHLVADGRQIAYHEDHDHWMVSGVYRYDNEADRAKIIIGTSERQAVANTMGFLSKGRLAYYDGHGPSYDYAEEVPGGASGSYQEGQTNAERLIHIHTGEDVPIEPVNGKYKLVNKASGKLVSLPGGNATIRQSVYQWEDGGLANQTWDVYPIDKATVGDYSYVVIRNANTSSIPLYLDAQAWNMDNGADASVWSDGDALTTAPNVWQRWHLDYVGDGYYHVINYESGLYLAVDNGGTGNGVNVHQWSNDGSDKLLWKFVPADHAVDATAPATPTGLTATPQSGSVKLTWAANKESDIYGYMVYRYSNQANIWECVGRKVQGTTFIDNICPKGQTLRYRIKALDGAYNLSAASAEVTTQTASGNALIAQWTGLSLKDNGPNKMHAVANGVTNTTDSNRPAFSFDGSDDYVKLPYHTGDMQQMTFAAWVKGSSTTAWQRIFDFGNGEDEYLFLTPTNGSAMRFEIKKGDTKQGLDTKATLGTGTWKHVAVTIGTGGVSLYINGEVSASSTSITLRPSDIAPTISYLGRSQFAADPAFKGLMSDVRIYNYALDANEVKKIAQTSVSAEDIENATKSGIADAEELLNYPMWYEARNALLDEIYKVMVAKENYIAKINNGTATSADGTVWTNAIKALNESEAMEKARASIEVYKGLATQIAIADGIKEANQRTYGHLPYANEMGEVKENYSNGWYADNVVEAVFVKIKGITNRYLMADAVALATETNPVDVTFMVSNPSFEGDSYASWNASPSPGMGYNAAEFYNTNFNIYQTLIGMPAGTYRFQTRGFYRYGSQGNHKDAHESNNIERNAVLYISHTPEDKASQKEETSKVMAISDDPSEDTHWGGWSSELYDGKPVPNNMQAGAHAIDGCGKYASNGDDNCVFITAKEIGDLTYGAKKEVAVAEDWTFFADFSLYYLGDGKHTLELDEKSDLPIINQRTVYEEVTMIRTMKADRWNTFVVPFDMDIPNDWEVKELTYSKLNGENITLTFDDADAIKAGVPYMVCVKKDVSKITVEKKEVSTKPTVASTEDIEFIGVYCPGNVPQGAFFISSNIFYRAADNSNTIKAFRAYLIPTGKAANARTLGYRFADEEGSTDIEEAPSVATEEVTVVAIYTLSGMRIEELQEGVNILQMSNGTTMKVVIK